MEGDVKLRKKRGAGGKILRVKSDPKHPERMDKMRSLSETKKAEITARRALLEQEAEVPPAETVEAPPEEPEPVEAAEEPVEEDDSEPELEEEEEESEEDTSDDSDDDDEMLATIRKLADKSNGGELLEYLRDAELYEGKSITEARAVAAELLGDD